MKQKSFISYHLTNQVLPCPTWGRARFPASELMDDNQAPAFEYLCHQKFVPDSHNAAASSPRNWTLRRHMSLMKQMEDRSHNNIYYFK